MVYKVVANIVVSDIKCSYTIPTIGVTFVHRCPPQFLSHPQACPFIRQAYNLFYVACYNYMGNGIIQIYFCNLKHIKIVMFHNGVMKVIDRCLRV